MSKVSSGSYSFFTARSLSFPNFVCQQDRIQLLVPTGAFGSAESGKLAEIRQPSSGRCVCLAGKFEFGNKGEGRTGSRSPCLSAGNFTSHRCRHHDGPGREKHADLFFARMPAEIVKELKKALYFRAQRGKVQG